MLLGFETLGTDLTGHRGDLVILGIGHLTLGPNKLTLQGKHLHGAKQKN